MLDKKKINNLFSSKINKPPIIVAELSANHNGSILKAKKLIRLAKKNGADLIKIQTYTPDTMTINSKKKDFVIKSGLWKGKSLYELYKLAQTPFEWQKELFEYAKKINIGLFSTPFDETAVDYLEDLNCPIYKVSSFEITDLHLIEYIAKTNKPIILSTGLSNEKEIYEAVKTIKKFSKKEIILLHCISEYPAKLENSNLNTITYLGKKFKLKIGLSDHTIGNTAALVATSLGACLIEKHFTDDRSTDKGPDSAFSMNPKELSNLSKQTKLIFKSLGNYGIKRSDQEKKNKIFRRSLYYNKDLIIGDRINKANVVKIRPGYGLDTKYYKKIIGKKIIRKRHRGDRVRLIDFEK